MSKNRRNTSLNGVKGVAIAFVVLYHLFPQLFKGGFLWVNTFLVLAGFFFARKMEQVLQEGQLKQGVWHYVKQTMKRLWVPLMSMLSVVVIFMVLLDRRELSYDRWDIVTSSLFANNIFQIISGRSYFEQMAGSSPFTHLWYTGLYVQSVIVGLLLAILLAKGQASAYMKAIIWASVGLLSTVWALFLYVPYADPSRVYYGLDTRFSSFAFGVALAYALPIVLNLLHDSTYKRMLCNLAGAFSLIAMLWLTFVVSDQSWVTYSVWLPLFNTLSVLLIFAIVTGTPLTRYVLGNAVLDSLGSRSYSYYLWYYPVLFYALRSTANVWVNSAIALTVLIVLAEIAYRMVEQRIALEQWNVVNDLYLIFDTYDKQALIRTGAIAFIGAFFMFGLIISGNNKRLALFELEYLQYKNAIHTVKYPFPHSEAMVETQAILSMIDQTLYTNFLSTQEKRVDFEQYIHAVNTLKAEITQQNELYAAFQQENPELAMLLTPEEVEFASNFPVTLFGDSVALLNSYNFREVFPKGTTFGEVSLSLYNGGMDRLKYLLAQGEVHSHIVVQMGTNGGVDAETLSEMIDLLEQRQIYFVTLHNGDIDDRQTYKVLKEVSDKFDNVYLLEWAAYAQGRDDWFIEDGVHQNNEGSAQYVAFIVRELYKLN